MRLSLVLLFLLAVAGVLLSTLRWLPDREQGGLGAPARDLGIGSGAAGPTDSAWPPPPTHPISRRPVPAEELRAAAPLPLARYNNHVRGRVLDGEGAPIVGARVTIGLHSGPPQGFENEAVTDGEGRFELNSVPPSAFHRIGVRHPEYACARLTEVEVGAEGSTELGTIPLRPATRLFGILRDSAARPVVGARLLLVHEARSACEPVNLEPVETRSDDRGRYEFPHVSPCQSTIVIEADGCANLQHSGLGDRLRSGREVQLDLLLAPPRRISGQVVDLEGRPIAGARLVAGLEPWRQRYCSEVTVSEADGRFKFKRLTAGDYSISASAEGYRITTARAFTDDRGVRLELLPLRTVRGVVLSREGRPLDPFHAWLHPAEIDPAVGDRSSWGESFHGTEGRFELRDILYGPCVVSAEAPGYATGSSGVFRIEGNTPVTGIELRLVRLGSIQAVAVDERGVPISGASLTAWYSRGDFRPNPLLGSAFGRTGRATAAADETGRCEVRDLPAGLYGIRIEAEGYLEHGELDVQVSDGVHRDLGRVVLVSDRQ